MPDYTKKAEVINNGTVKNLKYFKRQLFLADTEEEIEYYNIALNYLESADPEGYAEACRVANADFRRNTRLKNRIKKFLEMGNCLFITITFTDDALNLQEHTRRVMVTRFLKSCSKYYIANKDFGLKHGREYYHAIVLADRVDFTAWKYGNLDVKRILQSSNPLVLAKYITKLTNHAVKETCKRNTIIYSRVDWKECSDDYWNAVAPLVE